MDALGWVLFAACVWIAVMLVIREFNCWYWKLNEITATLDEILACLKKAGAAEPGHVAVSDERKAALVERCPACNAELTDPPAPEHDVMCPSCSAELQFRP